jgi:predicted MPP superfamily phosphohydrolase
MSNTIATIGILLLAFLGHAGLCVGGFNRAAGSTLPCFVVGWLEKLCVALGAIVPLACAWWLWSQQIDSFEKLRSSTSGVIWLGYLAICVVITLWYLPRWLAAKMQARPVPQLLSNHTEHCDVAEELGHWPVGSTSTRLMRYFPGNEICKLALPTKTLSLTALPKALDGLSIVHLSDLHMTGQLTLDFYRHAVERANCMRGDLVVITGDIVDKAACLEWLPETLGKLRAKHGVYFVLGNHDLRLPSVDALRSRLSKLGLVDVGGRAVTLNIKDCEVHLAGNELPWFPLRANNDVFTPEAHAGDYFRILLAHSPDQYAWARQRGYPLMLAGHNHGGQIRLPWVGPIVCPSRHGAKHAGGLYYEAPTLLHVSRGLAGTHPLRLNCTPEIAKLVLKHARTEDAKSDSAKSSKTIQAR